MTHAATADDRLICALDLPRLGDAEDMVARLGDAVSFYKIGYQLLPLGGYDLARRLRELGKRTFLDLKLLDIGSTVEKGVRSLAAIAPDMVTIHADRDTIEGAVQGRGDAKTALFCVTVLTSWGQDAINEHGYSMDVTDLVIRRAEMAAQYGADGVIASAREAKDIRAHLGDRLRIVTPGIRPKGAAADDQKRITVPRDAITAGANGIVVGRPITAADDPAAAARDIVAEIRA